MTALVFETTCGEWDVVTTCDDAGNVKVLKGFTTEENAREAIRQIGWRFLAVVKIQAETTY
jgi:hypothetical protein